MKKPESFTAPSLTSELQYFQRQREQDADPVAPYVLCVFSF